jgi:hypothetical protein
MRSEVPSRLGVTALVTAAGAVWLWHTGPVPVVRVSTVLPEYAPFWYMLAAFPVLGMLVADLVVMARRGASRRAMAELATALALLVALGQARLALHLPVSGHAMLAAYFIVRRSLLGVGDGGYARGELVVGVGVLAAVAYPKLLWWHDPISLGVGVLVGGILALGVLWGPRSARNPG